MATNVVLAWEVWELRFDNPLSRSWLIVFMADISAIRSQKVNILHAGHHFRLIFFLRPLQDDGHLCFSGSKSVKHLKLSALLPFDLKNRQKRLQFMLRQIFG